MSTRSAVLLALAAAAPARPGSAAQRTAACKVSHCVRKAPTLTPRQPPDTALWQPGQVTTCLWQPGQVTACPPEPDVIGLAVRTRHAVPALSRPVRGVSPTQRTGRNVPRR